MVKFASFLILGVCTLVASVPSSSENSYRSELSSNLLKSAAKPQEYVNKIYYKSSKKLKSRASNARGNLGNKKKQKLNKELITSPLENNHVYNLKRDGVIVEKLNTEYIEHGVNEFNLAPVDINKNQTNRIELHLAPINSDIDKVNIDKPNQSSTPKLMRNSDNDKGGENASSDKDEGDEEVDGKRWIGGQTEKVKDKKKKRVSGGISESKFKKYVRRAKCASNQRSGEINSSIRKYRKYFPYPVYIKKNVSQSIYTNSILNYFGNNQYGSYKENGKEITTLNYAQVPKNDGLNEFFKIKFAIEKLYGKINSEYHRISMYIIHIPDMNSNWYKESLQETEIISIFVKYYRKYLYNFNKSDKDVFDRHYFVEHTEKIFTALNKEIPDNGKC
ncbi:hypothetical protein AYI69_g4499 [Smittium culicis]|uniref:Uncharacterized protein n=1 Tax=Smittium culicis TaxID=133412 RepID=A0A1R1YDS9_9FUNG|nr:hypothetical protein AYI69_g4499 [Smittium culicis]